MVKNFREYKVEEDCRTLLERYESLFDFFMGKELNSLENIPELSRDVLRGEYAKFLYKLVKDTKRIISENYSDNLFPIERILGISQKAQRIEVGLEKLAIDNKNKGEFSE